MTSIYRYIRCEPLPSPAGQGEKEADVAELADALDSGSSARKGVEVQVLSSALLLKVATDR